MESIGNGHDAPDPSMYSNVIFKKKSGTLLLNKELLEFRTDNASLVAVAWKDVLKHQVSPANYPKALLKILLKSKSNGKSSSLTFQLSTRPELEQLRKEITSRLSSENSHGNKRSYAEFSQKSFGELNGTEIAVTRSALLAANQTLRQQHKYLVEETQTVSEVDFWKTHHHALEDEYAQISGLTRPGTSSVLQSHLPSSGRVRLGVQEMRQIFILYPAVHRAYEETVPLEVSDEQFWRKYLESEFFHRDRGRVGTLGRNHSRVVNNNDQDKEKTSKEWSIDAQDARAAAVGTDDMFSRYDQKLRDQKTVEQQDASSRKWGRHLAIGQFDLASTFETERGDLLAGPKDNHPPNTADEEKGSRVIQKYNRHWAMVLHPDQAVAGSNLQQVARRSVLDPKDDDAAAMGGVDREMRNLVDFANAPEEEANHAKGQSLHDGLEYEPLTLKNVEAYYTGNVESEKSKKLSDEDAAKKHTVFAKAMAAKTQALVQALPSAVDGTGTLPESSFPPPKLGHELLTALTKKMAKDSQTEAQSLEVVKNLPEDFREKLQTYFRRSSELLRHFFGLRRLEAAGGENGGQTKLARIVRGMETFYREMEGMYRDLPQTETGATMRKMCLPIMDQLDWAFKLRSEGSGGGGGGGFVTVEQN